MRKIELLTRASEGGDYDATFQLAVMLLVGELVPRDLNKARNLLRQARLAGHADATLMEISLTASGAGGPPQWREALNILNSASSIPTASDQINLLAQMDLDGDGNPKVVPTLELLSDGPQVWIARKFLTVFECVHIATTATPIMLPSTVIDPETGRLIAHPIRTSTSAQIGPTRETLPIQAILRRIASATNSDVFCGEPLTVLRYSKGQQYKPHVDAVKQFSNQRDKTVLLYLNDGYIGGETEFLNNGLKVSARQGDAVIFSNVLPNGHPDPESVHSGRPVLSGVKWLATRWIRAKAFDPWLA